MLRVAVAIFLLSAFSASAEECDPPDNSTHFVRAHDVGNYRGEPSDSGSDDLFIAAKADSARAFCLNTVGTNYHLCGLEGTLTERKGGVLRYTDPQNSACTLEFTPTKAGYRLRPSRGWEREGTCQKQHCGMYAEILSGVFTKVS